MNRASYWACVVIAPLILLFTASGSADGSTGPSASGNATASIMDEFNGSTLGVAHGLTYVHTLDGEGAVFSRAAGSYIQYPEGIPRQGTLEWWIKVDSGYSFNNFVLTRGQTRALIFTTDVAGGDVTWPGSAWVWVSANGDITFYLATRKYQSPPAEAVIARGTKFRFGQWHSIGISYGSKGQAIEVDGRLAATEPGNTQSLGSGGNHYAPLDLPTIGESVSHFWAPRQYSGGFDGTVDRFRASAAQRDWVLSAVDLTARRRAGSKPNSGCANATDLSFSLTADGRTYHVKAVSDDKGKQIPIFVDAQGSVVRNNQRLLQELALGVWTRENIIASVSTRAELAQKDTVLSNAVQTLQAMNNYQTVQDLLARGAATALEATVTGGTSLPAGLEQLTVGELTHQLQESPRTLLTLTALYGLNESKSLYDQLTPLLYPASATVLDVDKLNRIYTLLMQAHTLELPNEALATALSPEYAGQLTQQALESVVGQVIPELGPVNPTATLTLDVLLKAQQGLAQDAATLPVLKGYQMNLNLALNLARAYDKQISTLAEQAATACGRAGGTASVAGQATRFPYVERLPTGGYELRLSQNQQQAVQAFLSTHPGLQLVTTHPGGLTAAWLKQAQGYMNSGEMQFPYAAWRDFNRDGFQDLALVFSSKTPINSWGWHQWWIVVFEGTAAGQMKPVVVTNSEQGSCFDGMLYQKKTNTTAFACFNVATGTFRWDGRQFIVRHMVGD